MTDVTNEKDTAKSRVLAAVEKSTKGHGRFSCWTGKSIAIIKIDDLRALVEGRATLGQVGDIELAVRDAEQARNAREFNCWAGSTGAMITRIPTADIRILITQARNTPREVTA